MLPLILFLSLSAAEPTPTQPAAQTSEPAKAASVTKTEKDDPVICRSYETTGSRLERERKCLKRSEWQSQDAEFKGDTIRQLNQMISPKMPGGG
jgi:hypothetical protein